MKTTLIFFVVAAIFTTFVEAELLEAQFITRLDHSRAQDLRTVSFVSSFLFNAAATFIVLWFIKTWFDIFIDVPCQSGPLRTWRTILH